MHIKEYWSSPKPKDPPGYRYWRAGRKKWMDSEVFAAMNISIKRLARFASSQRLAGEAMKGNPTTPVILRIDASKSALRRKLTS